MYLINYPHTLILVVVLFGSMGIKQWEFESERKGRKGQKYLQEGNILLREFKYYEAALQFEKAGELGASNLRNIINNYKDLYEAQKLVADSPNDFEANFSLAVLYHSYYKNLSANDNANNFLISSYFGLAEQQYKKAISLDNSKEAQALKGLVSLYMEAGKWDSALEHLSKLTALNPKDYEASGKVAFCNLEKGNISEAEKLAKNVLIQDSQCCRCYWILGRIGEMNQKNTAGELYKRALKCNPSLLKENRIQNVPQGSIKVIFIVGYDAVIIDGIEYNTRKMPGVRRIGSGGGRTGPYIKKDPVQVKYVGKFCEAQDIQVYLYNADNNKKYPMENKKPVSIPIGYYNFYASFINACGISGMVDKTKNKKIEYSYQFSISYGQALNLDLTIKPSLEIEKAAIIVNMTK